MNVVGLGRVCVDVHLKASSEAGRYDASKFVGVEVRSLGGSTPWILAHLAKAGSACRFTGPGASAAGWFEECLSQLGVEAQLLDVDVTNSYIIYDRAGKVQHIFGVEETGAALLPADAGRSLGGAFDWLVIDFRHPAAASAAVESARQHGAAVLLDPGSTIGLHHLGREHGDCLSAVTLLCTDSLGLMRITGLDDVEAAVRVLLNRGVETIVHTGARGEAELFSGGLRAGAEQLEDHAVGSTLGVGDAFRGWLLASLAESGVSRGKLPDAETAGRALRWGLAAAMARKADPRLLPSPLSRSDVEPFLARTRLR